MRVPISVLILTHNEERNLDACLKSVVAWASEVFVVDSFSQDRTCDIAKGYGATVLQHEFKSHGAQRNWALANVPFRQDWVLALDADHQVTPELAAELETVIPAAAPNDVGFFIKRRQIFRKRWIRHGGYYPKYMLKVFRRKNARFDEDELDDRVYVTGHTRRLRSDIIEDNANEASIGFWIEKHNRYAGQTALDELKIRQGLKALPLTPHLFGNPNEQIYWFKQHWYKMPLYLRPAVYFFYRYFLRLGILDGKEGFIFHFLQAFWFRLLVDIKLDELMRPTAASHPR